MEETRPVAGAETLGVGETEGGARGEGRGDGEERREQPVGERRSEVAEHLRLGRLKG